MNLSEALDAALPEMPRERLARPRLPRLDPNLVVREDTLDGEQVFSIIQREKGTFYRMPPAQWQLALLFDGEHTCEEIAELFSEQTGSTVDPSDVRVFADNMAESDFWYKTPQERNLALNAKLTAQRSRRVQQKAKVNLAHISFSGWDPDRYLGWLDRAAGRFIYSQWCVLAVMLLFLFEVTVFVSQWSNLGPDIALYYNFSHKSLLDLAQFWMLFLVLGFLHETAHGLTCKHYGGEVHSMGLMFLYLLPAFYVDVTEIWTSATKLQRLATIIAGIWIEMTVCGIAMIVWANTFAGQWIHDFTYQVILITGVAVVVVNLNPLIKLDGYYLLTDIIGIPDLKERSTAFLSAWFQNQILRLPVETPVVPRRRAPLFVFYAVASGLYSYTLLFFIIRLSYNVTSQWLGEFALIPASGLAFLMFRSRLRSLRNVTIQFWEQKVRGWKWSPLHIAAAALLVAVLFLPLWRDRENAYYVIEPSHLHALRAAVPGRVSTVFVHQGERVRAGEELLRMSSFASSSMTGAAAAQTGNARFASFNAELHGQSTGAASADQTSAAHFTAIAHEAQSSLVLVAPANGSVLTINPSQLVDQNVGSGQELLNLADDGPQIARIFVPANALDRIPQAAEVALALPDRFSIVRLPLSRLGGEPVALPPGLVASQDYKGMKLPVFYSTRIELPPLDGNPLFGVAGEAKIFGARRSVAERFLTVAVNLVKAHVW